MRLQRITVSMLALCTIAFCTQGCNSERLGGGGAEPPARRVSEQTASAEAGAASIEGVLQAARDRITAAADSMDDVLRPVQLLRGSEEAALRRYLQAQQLDRARQLGIALPRDASDLTALQQQGALVRLPDSTDLWIVRRLDHSLPLVTPDAEALLREIGRRYQARLSEMGLPPLRIEVSSALRTEAMQSNLQQTNPNAARGRSTHEYGTSIDIAYNSYAAPANMDLTTGLEAPDWLRPYLGWMATTALERIAAQRSAELKAILGQLLIGMQQEGKVMVTLEERQPVYHLTVAQRYK